METFLGDLLPALQRQQIEVAALVHDHQRGRLSKPVRPDQTAPVTVYRAPSYGRLLYAPVSPRFRYWLDSVIKQFKPTALHLHLPNTSAFWAMTRGSARQLPWIVHWHADVVSSVIERRLAAAYHLYRPFEQLLLVHSKTILVTSPTYLAASPALTGWQEKCRILPLGLDPARIADPDASSSQSVQSLWGTATIRILAIGRLTYYKGFQYLIEAAARLIDARIVIVGRGEQHELLARLIEQHRLQDRVILAGYQSDSQLHALFASCDMLCLPSIERTEAFGVVLLEAMRFAKPVVAADIPGSGVGWVVREGGHGLLVPPTDSRALATALARLADDKQLRTRLAATGHQRLNERFHIEAVARQLADLYRSLPVASADRRLP